jgi:aspartyl-tRNA(Asn)/glutamyl-tRNA(Gln) amidotransferase subunit A
LASGIHALGVVSLLEAFRAGRVSVVAATDHYLERIARHDPVLKAFTHVEAEAARAAAADSAARYDAETARALEGVPVAVKANIDVAGWPVHGGMAAFAGRVPAADAAVVARLKAAGAVILGLTNLHEGALGATTDNEAFGRTENPHRIGFTAGGSSGGSGAAVAAGLCAAALGTDTLGSIRIPASYCGIAGLKPGFGRVPTAGLMHLVERLDCIGPMARSVGDCAALFAVLADTGPGDAAPAPARVGTLWGAAEADLHPAVAAALRLAESLLEGLGLRVEAQGARFDHGRVRLAGFVEAALAADRLFGADVARNPQGFSETFRSHLAFARGIDTATVAQGRRATDQAAAELQAALGLADVLLLPATPQPAFAHDGPAPVSVADWTALANFAGLPALSIPAGWTRDGLPVAVQLVGRAGADEALLALGARLETALNAWGPPKDFG